MEVSKMFSTMPAMYWSKATQMSYLQRRIIVYSIMYYQLNESCVPDHVYEEYVKQLCTMMKDADAKALERTAYYYVMYDFDGSTGFYLYDRLNKKDKAYLMQLAKHILEQWHREVQG